LETRKDSLDELQNDETSKKIDQEQIKSYFDFSNPKFRKRHSILLTIEIINFLILIITLISFPLTNNWKYTLISVFTVIFLVSIILFLYKNASYRFLSYILDALGMVFVLFIPNYSDIPDNVKDIVLFVWIVLGICDAIILLYFVSIEFSQERYIKSKIRQKNVRIYFRRV
jgi:hypothetical protein